MIICEHWNKALIPPKERRFIPPSPEEQQRLNAGVALLSPMHIGRVGQQLFTRRSQQ